MTVPEYEQYIRDYFGKNASQVLARYPARTPEEVKHRMARIITDFDFDGTTKVAAGSMANLNRSTYLYRFTYVLPGQPNGAFHGSELPFVFRPGILNLDPASSTVSNNMMDLWVRFAKTGNPNGGMNVTWPKYNAETDQYLDIGAAPIVKTGY